MQTTILRVPRTSRRIIRVPFLSFIFVNLQREATKILRRACIPRRENARERRKYENKIGSSARNTKITAYKSLTYNNSRWGLFIVDRFTREQDGHQQVSSVIFTWHRSHVSTDPTHAVSLTRPAFALDRLYHGIPRSLMRNNLLGGKRGNEWNSTFNFTTVPQTFHRCRQIPNGSRSI